MLPRDGVQAPPQHEGTGTYVRNHRHCERERGGVCVRYVAPGRQAGHVPHAHNHAPARRSGGGTVMSATTPKGLHHVEHAATDLAAHVTWEDGERESLALIPRPALQRVASYCRKAQP